LKKVIVDGREHSPAKGQVRALVKGNGEVERVDK
jgi:hypothetical protein